jgi:ferrous iron transport protein B
MTTIPLVALVGNPNAGKSALFNKLTGARQKVGNYPGVTVERKSGRVSLPDGRPIELVDLPGAYSLDASSPDEEVTRDVVVGRQQGERRPDALLVVLDATNLDNHLRFALQLIALGIPIVVALNMVDLAKRDGLTIDPQLLERELGVPVIETVAVRRRGIDDLKEALSRAIGEARPRPAGAEAAKPDFTAVQRRAREISRRATVSETATRRWSHLIDNVALHPVAGPLIFASIMFLMFQGVFAWSEAPIALLESAVSGLQAIVARFVPEGFLRSLLADGVLAGVGSVVVFLPPDPDPVPVHPAPGSKRLHGPRGFHDGPADGARRPFRPRLHPAPLLLRLRDPRHHGDAHHRRSQAPPHHDPDRAAHDLFGAPAGLCDHHRRVHPVQHRRVRHRPSGLVLFALYAAGIVGALLAALILRRTVTKGVHQGFMMEMPKYQLPSLRDVAIGLWTRALIFLKRAGTIILVSTVILWALLSFPQPKPGESALDSSIAGKLASGLEVVVRPIGFNHEIALALIPAMAAREVAVSALATAYSIEAEDEAKTEQSLTDSLRGRWSLPTALAFLAWFVFAPQCISTIAVARRETNGWRWPAFMLAYLFGLAYLAAGATYWAAIALGL